MPLITLRPQAKLDLDIVWINDVKTTLRAAMDADPLAVEQLEIRCCDDLVSIDAPAAQRIDVYNCHHLDVIRARAASLVYLTPYRGVQVFAPQAKIHHFNPRAPI